MGKANLAKLALVGLVATAALLLLSCTGGKQSGTAPASGGANGALPIDPLKLIYWDRLNFYGGTVPEDAQATYDAIAASGDLRFVPFLLDLAVLPTPFDVSIHKLLPGWIGPMGDFGTFSWVEQQGYRTPADDTPEYLAFKHRLFSTLQPELGAFLDPTATRMISAQEILWGGVYVDGIPPLESPRMVTPAVASSWIRESDQVIGVELNGDSRAYPRRIIDWHEMVNDTVGGIPVSLAYCTLCNSAILYDGRHEGQVFRFGTSGMLYRSNKLMYDRTTRTLWEQFSGEPVWGELAGKGIRLEALPVTHTTWGEWLAEHPTTKVLDINTGFDRDYGPGVAYADYFDDPQLMFPAPNRSGPLRPKDVVYVVRLGDALTAYPVKLLAERGFIEDRIGDRDVIVVATADGSGGRAYDRRGLEFASYDARRRSLKPLSGEEWRVTESGLVGPGGETRERLPGHNSFWFSVLNHTRDGKLYGQ
ncbi:DUF3179 domain-containing protein [bacterium]|nr:MAG: DUF3179 domain-containing protein [bacterium]MCL4232641.1 DUF3179 domain-containing protein [Dehalococcoidia bacterium]